MVFKDIQHKPSNTAATPSRQTAVWQRLAASMACQRAQCHCHSQLLLLRQAMHSYFTHAIETWHIPKPRK